jgi:hypothetical protein
MKVSKMVTRCTKTVADVVQGLFADAQASRTLIVGFQLQRRVSH